MHPASQPRRPTMETLKITKADLNERNEYTRSRDLEFEGHIEIEASLGWVKILGLIRAGGGLSIKAGSSIEAGWSIRCKAKLTVKLRIFAGLCTWRLPKPEELVIECAELTEGTVCFGDLKLLPAKTEAATASIPRPAN